MQSRDAGSYKEFEEQRKDSWLKGLQKRKALLMSCFRTAVSKII